MSFRHRGWVVGRIIGPLGALTWVTVLLALAAPAHATFPGLNGKIAFSSNASGNYEIYTVNPDGSGLANLTNSAQQENYPAWSADGKKIVFTRDAPTTEGDCGYLWTMNADGSGATQLTPAQGGWQPAWSPDGEKLVAGNCGDYLYTVNTDGSAFDAFFGGDHGGERGIDWSPDGQTIAFTMLNYTTHSGNFLVTIKPDGSDWTDISPNAGDLSELPTWSPDGAKIAYYFNSFDSVPLSGVYTVSPDGTGDTQIKGNAAGSRGITWSPDKTKIAYTQGTSLYTMNADGSSAAAVPGVNLGSNDFAGQWAGQPDWQPLRPPGYARPKSATPATIRLVPAETPCASANSTHGAPLAVPSCNPPHQTSGYATVGTPDANGAAAKSTGLLTAKAVGEAPIDLNNGDQTDIAFTVSITDVRDKQTPTLDYSGELRAAFNLRLTDRYSGPGLIHPATATDTIFAFTIPCAVTVDPAVGSTCSTSTSADAVMPGITPEFTRAVWEVGQVQVYDGGSDGDGDTTGDNTLFMTQGLFAP